MKTIGIFEAKTKLSQICETIAATGKPSIIAKHGKPLVKIVPYATGENQNSVWDSIAESTTRFGPLDEDWESPGREADSDWSTGCFEEE